MVGRQEGANHKKRSCLVLEAGSGRADGPGDCKWRSDWKAFGSWKKRESPALFRPNTVEARSRSVGPPGSLVPIFWILTYYQVYSLKIFSPIVHNPSPLIVSFICSSSN
uniref:Uncharacterized protein n=1 Tax=Urocitellus parryii TaxID=9999 RepID=A0A8D2HIT6_UROPR